MSASRPIFVGFDLETSGTEHGVHVPIQAGAALGARRSVSVPIGWPDPPWDDEAEKVHGFTRGYVVELAKGGFDAAYADAELAGWLRANTGAEGKQLVAVGWNVGAFDLPFVAAHLPETMALFSRRTVDLNSACFTLALRNEQLCSLNPRHPRMGWEAWKRAAKRHAAAELGTDPRWHDAEYDAVTQLVAWRWLAAQEG